MATDFFLVLALAFAEAFFTDALPDLSRNPVVAFSLLAFDFFAGHTDAGICLATGVSSPRSNSQSAARDATAKRAASNFDPQPLANSMRRIWTSGPYHADAEFLALDGNIVRLRRVNEVRTSIPLEKLSMPDQAWIRAHLASQ